MATLEEFKALRKGVAAEVHGELYRLVTADPEASYRRMVETVSSVMKTSRNTVCFWLAFGLAINAAFHPVKALERLGTMPGTAAPRSWRNDTSRPLPLQKPVRSSHRALLPRQQDPSFGPCLMP